MENFKKKLTRNFEITFVVTEVICLRMSQLSQMFHNVQVFMYPNCPRVTHGPCVPNVPCVSNGLYVPSVQMS